MNRKTGSVPVSGLKLCFILVLGLAALPVLAQPAHGPLGPQETVRGWNILSDSVEDAIAVINSSRRYQINHLQLSHNLVHNLREVKKPERRDTINRLIDRAHEAGIREVVLWDHCLYDLDYYPKEFRTGPDGTLDLDNPEFWSWLKQDYRSMLDLVPAADGLVLTFIETGARAERQHSRRLNTNAEKLAAVVNAVCDVVIKERGKAVYARTFGYTRAEYADILSALNLIKHPEMRLMMKETPHDFFLTHPDDFFAGQMARTTIIEFDAAGEFNGQGLIANTWPEYVLRRCRNLLRRNHVIGYVARTDRYHDTRIVGRPSEINLWALKRSLEDKDITAEQVYEEFIADRYGARVVAPVKRAFKNAFDIVTSTLYTLGTNIANHSRLDYDPYASSYARHVSGKWIDPPIAYVGHGVNREFHYWRDVVAHLAPPEMKSPASARWREIPGLIETGWIRPEEEMTQEYLSYILAEKDYGIRLAEQSVRAIDEARPDLRPADYDDLHHYFARTLLTARLHRMTAGAYFGHRAYTRGGAHQTAELAQTIRECLEGVKETAKAIQQYPVKPATGQWKWDGDADQALKYYKRATATPGMAGAEVTGTR